LPSLQGIYTPPAPLYATFRRTGVAFAALDPTSVRMMMDIVYIVAIAVFLLVTCALAAGCDKLGRRE
jgi:hypothetical protein